MADEQIIDGPMQPPRFDAPDTKRTVIDQEVEAQIEFTEGRTLKQAWTDGVMSTVAAKMQRNISQRVDPQADFLSQVFQAGTAAIGQSGKWGEGKWDKAAHYGELTKDVPREYWEDIFEQTSLEGARISRTNIMAEMSRGQRMGMDSGTAALLGISGLILDIDAPLILASGGSMFAAKAAGRVARATNSVRLAGLAGGAVAGAEAGVLIGAGEALSSDVSTWVDGVAVALGSIALGGTLGTIAPELFGSAVKMKSDLETRVADGDGYVYGDNMEGWTDEVPASRSVDWKTADIAAAPDAEVAGVTDVPAFIEPNAAKDLSAKAMQGPAVFPALTDPLEKMSDVSKKIIQASRTRMWSVDFNFKKKAAFEDTLTRISTNPVFNIGTGDVMGLLKSNSTVANRLIHDIFELPGRQISGETANSATLQKMYQGIGGTHKARVPLIQREWAQRNGKQRFTIGGKPVGIQDDALREFNRRVYLDMNAASLGKPRDPDDLIRQASDMYGAAGKHMIRVAKGKPGEIPLDGADLIPEESFFIPYRANGRKMAKAIIDKKFSREQLVDAYAQSYLNVGAIRTLDMAKEIAEAYVTRFLSKATHADDSMISLFGRDGREFLREGLMQRGMSQTDVENFMRRFDNEMTERGKITSLKHRNDLDFSVPIGDSGLAIVDMMRGDLDSVYEGYVREMAGASALARYGITSRANRREWVDAMLSEQRALGEAPMDGEKVMAMFSAFDGGVEWGYGRLGGTNKGIGAMAAVKSMASLSALPFNVFAQLGETGIGVVAVGAKTWFNRGIGGLVDNAIKSKSKAVLAEFGPLLGDIGKDQIVLRSYMNLDEVDEYSHGAGWAQAFALRVSEVTAKANELQGYVTFLHHVRGWQQQYAALGMADKLFRMIKDNNFDQFDMGARVYRDLGFDRDFAERLREQVTNGNVSFATKKWRGIGKTTYVDRLNLEKWPADLAQEFAAGLKRGMNQTVQAAMAGETDRWMHTVWGSMLTHLQTFPILAVQKQFFRNAQSKDAQAVAAALAGFATAYASLTVRDQFTGSKRDAAERVKAAVGYANITGWMPMYTDPIMGVLGMEDLRFNQFGAYAEPLQVPSLDIINHLVNAPGAVLSLGEEARLSYQHKQHIRAIPFVRIAESIVRMGSFGKLELVSY